MNCLRLALPPLAAHGLQHAPVGAADPQPGQAVVVELDDVLVADPADEDVGLDVVRAVGAELAAGVGLQRAASPRAPPPAPAARRQLLGHRRELPAQEEVPGLVDHPPRQRLRGSIPWMSICSSRLSRRSTQAMPGGSKQRTMASASSTSARVYVAPLGVAHREDLLGRGDQEAVGVEVADDQLDDLALAGADSAMWSCQSRWS